MTIRRAGGEDAAELVRVINAAFGPAEDFFVEGDRIDLAGVRAYLEKGVFLVEAGMGGCVYVELRGERAYFGLLSVDPARQGSGIGKLLIAAAESYAREHGCHFMDIRIVNLREELPAFYGRLGYVAAGEEAFTEAAATKLPCHFIVMEKRLNAV
jgi:GNAT superfamily N-acetyltransferase